MRRRKLISIITLVALFISSFAGSLAFAADGNVTKLIVHFQKSNGQYIGDMEAVAFDGKRAGTKVEQGIDDYGLKVTYEFQNAATNAYLGFTVKEDRLYGSDLRYVRAVNGVAEVWLKDGDARVFKKPMKVNPAWVKIKDKKAYIALEDMTGLLGIGLSNGKNGYVFDGKANGTVNVTTITHGRNYYEIDTDNNKMAYNATGNMLNNFTSEKLVFKAVDGYKENNKYYLSVSYFERLFQIAHVVQGNDDYFMEKAFVAYDEVTNAGNVEDLGFSQSKLDELDDYMNNTIDQGFPGAAVVVVKDGKVIKESAYGYAKKYDTLEVDGELQSAVLLPEEEWTPVTTNTLFDLASNSKMYATNYAIQKLVSEGRLDLDQKLVQFPGWENFKDANTIPFGTIGMGKTGKETISIRDILHHGGGLIPDPAYPNKNTAGELWYQTDDVTDRTGIIDIICRTPLQTAPRTAFAYSDIDYMILGLIVEQITGMPLDTYMEQEFYGKMGLTNTVFNPLLKGFAKEGIAATELNGNTRDGFINNGEDEDGNPLYIREYTLQGEVHDEKAWYSMAGVAGHAGLFSTVGDMGKLTQVMLNGGIYNGQQFFSQEVAKEFVQPYPISPYTIDSSTIGLGWRVHSKNAAAYYYFNWGPSRSTYGHQGWTGTLTIIDPEYNMAITILTNMRHSPVVSKPNGFQAANYPLADMVTVSARVYDALITDKEQVKEASSIAPVSDIQVAYGTTEAQVLEQLPVSAVVTDTNGDEHAAKLDWTLASYDGSEAGQYTATATATLPRYVEQPATPLDLTLTAQVTVNSRIIVLPEDPSPGTELSSNNDLKALQVTADDKALSLTPAFDSATTSYEVTTKAEQVTLSAASAHVKANAAWTGQNGSTATVDLVEGDQSFEVVVTAENGSKKSYIVKIIREAGEDDGEGNEPDPVVALKDIAGHWAESLIKQAVKLGFVDGYEDGTFKPEGKVTRGEFVHMLNKAFKLEQSNDAWTFEDPAQSWAVQSIKNAAAAGIVDGFEDGTFRPEAPISRAEMAVMIARASGWKLSDAAITTFADDKQLPSWARGAIAALQENGIVEGKEGNHFDPAGESTRAESTAVMLRLLASLGD